LTKDRSWIQWVTGVSLIFLVIGMTSPVLGEKITIDELNIPTDIPLKRTAEFSIYNEIYWCPLCCTHPECYPMPTLCRCPKYCVKKQCTSPTTIILIRHADRDGSNDALTNDGFIRAAGLSHVAESAGISTIYVTDAQRSKSTVANLASQLNLNPIIYPFNEYTKLKNYILTGNKSQTVLVAGHSDTIDHIVTAFGGPMNSCPVTTNSQYDNLCIITIGCDTRDITVLHLHYGAKK